MTLGRTDVFVERERALENEFFRRVDCELMERLRSELVNEELRFSLAVAARISSEALLDKVMRLGVKPESLAAVNLIPLVLVSWSNGETTTQGRNIVLAAAAEEGVKPGSAAYDLLDNWLSHRPENALFETWKLYVQELCAGLSPAQRREFRDQTLAWAGIVARRSHRTLGFEWATSNEKQLMQQLKSAFTEL